MHDTLDMPPALAHMAVTLQRGVPMPDPSILAGQLSPSSITGYRRDLHLFLSFCATQNQLTVG